MELEGNLCVSSDTEVVIDDMDRHVVNAILDVDGVARDVVVSPDANLPPIHLHHWTLVDVH